MRSFFGLFRTSAVVAAALFVVSKASTAPSGSDSDSASRISKDDKTATIAIKDPEIESFLQHALEHPMSKDGPQLFWDELLTYKAVFVESFPEDQKEMCTKAKQLYSDIGVLIGTKLPTETSRIGFFGCLALGVYADRKLEPCLKGSQYVSFLNLRNFLYTHLKDLTTNYNFDGDRATGATEEIKAGHKKLKELMDSISVPMSFTTMLTLIIGGSVAGLAVIIGIVVVVVVKSRKSKAAAVRGQL